MPSPSTWLVCALALLFAPAVYAHPDGAPPEKVRLQLKWLHQFQFAGFYVAQDKGYYRERGLEVELVEGGPSVSATEEVVSGRAEYGIGSTQLLVDRVKGAPVVVLGVLFQHSPLIFLSLAGSGIASPSDLVGRRVGITAESEVEIYSTIESEAVSKASIDFLPRGPGLADLLEGKADAISAYSTAELLEMERQGLAWAAVRPIAYGIDFYGDCLFAAEAELRRSPERAKAFLEASLRGWEEAFRDPGAAADLILARYSTRKDKSALLAEAEAMRDLVLPELVPLGFQNPGRWTHIGDTYARLGAIPSDYSLRSFIYAPERRGDPALTRALLVSGGTLLALALAYIAVLRLFNRRLSAQVALRTAGLAEANGRLEAEIRAGAAREERIAASLAEKEVLLREVHHRVKNNLQLVASLLSLELAKSSRPPSDQLLLELRSRVFSMASVHESLYEGEDLARVDLAAYLGKLVEEIRRSFGRPELHVEARLVVEPLAVPVDRAIPLGLLVGELLTNSMKYAFFGRERGLLRVEGAREPGEAGGYRLLVADDGPGLPRRPAAAPGLGLEIVGALAEQLGAELVEGPGPGRVVELRFDLGTREAGHGA